MHSNIQPQIVPYQGSSWQQEYLSMDSMDMLRGSKDTLLTLIAWTKYRNPSSKQVLTVQQTVCESKNAVLKAHFVVAVTVINAELVIFPGHELSDSGSQGPRKVTQTAGLTNISWNLDHSGVGIVLWAICAVLWQAKSQKTNTNDRCCPEACLCRCCADAHVHLSNGDECLKFCLKLDVCGCVLVSVHVCVHVFRAICSLTSRAIRPKESCAFWQSVSAWSCSWTNCYY